MMEEKMSLIVLMRETKIPNKQYFSGNLLLCQPVVGQNKFSIKTETAIWHTVRNMLNAEHTLTPYNSIFSKTISATPIKFYNNYSNMAHFL